MSRSHVKYNVNGKHNKSLKESLMKNLTVYLDQIN